MPITVPRARVKEKCGVTDSAYDAIVDNLIAEQVPVLEAALSGEAAADSARLPTLTLGATEVVCGELVAQIARSEAVFFHVTLGDVSVRPVDVADPSGLIARGIARLSPYFRTDVAPAGPTVQTAGSPEANP